MPFSAWVVFLAISQNQPVAPGPNRGYLHVSPGIGAFTPIADTALPTWNVGANAGWHFQRRRLAGQLGVFFEDIIHPGEGWLHELHGGAELRLGGAPDNVFVYGVGRIGPTYASPYVWMRGSIGPGAQVSFAKHLTAGGEFGLSFGGETGSQIFARAFVGVWF